MISIALLLIFTAFYVFYNTSKKAVKNPSFGFENWILKNIKAAKIIGLAFLLIACSLLCHFFGFGVGIFLFFMALMTFGSLIILLNPIKIFDPINLIIILTISLCIEFFV